MPWSEDVRKISPKVTSDQDIHFAEREGGADPSAWIFWSYLMLCNLGANRMVELWDGLLKKEPELQLRRDIFEDEVSYSRI